MRKLYIILLILLSCSIQLLKAQDAGKKFRFASNNTYGVLVGEAGNAFHVQSVNGLEHKSFFAGLGVGIDNYGLRSIPLFLDIRKNILDKPNTPFVYVDGGYHFPWKKAEEGWYETKTSGGLYYEAGLGYQLPIKGAAILFSAGYSYKAYKEVFSYPTFCIDGNCPDYSNTYRYQLRRISIRAGVRF
jgi:hypothetical protein